MGNGNVTNVGGKVSLGLPQEELSMRRLSKEEASLFLFGPKYLNIGFFFRDCLAGVLSFGNNHGIPYLYDFHSIMRGRPFIARRMAKFLQSLIKATKRGCCLFQYSLDGFNHIPYGEGVFYFKPYVKIWEVHLSPLTKSFMLEVR